MDLFKAAKSLAYHMAYRYYGSKATQEKSKKHRERENVAIKENVKYSTALILHNRNESYYTIEFC